MARQTKAAGVAWARERGEAGHDARTDHPEVADAIRQSCEKAVALRASILHDRARFDQIDDELRQLYQADPCDDQRAALLLSEQQKIAERCISLTETGPFQFDQEIPPGSPLDPFCEERAACLKHGIQLMIHADADGAPIVLTGVTPEADDSSVRVARHQALVPLPRWVLLEVDLHASRDALRQDFDATVVHLKKSRTGQDPAPVPGHRRRNPKKLRVSITMLNLFETGFTLKEIGRRFGLHGSSVKRRLEDLSRIHGKPMPERGKRLSAAPPGKRCKDCPSGGCINCALAQDPIIRETIRNEEKWKKQRVYPPS